MTASSTAMVTGGSRGIGRACAQRMALDGHRVAVVGRSPADLATTVSTIRSNGGSADAYECDLTEEEAVADLVASVGTVEVLVHGAGAASSAPLATTTTSETARLLELNALAPLSLTRALLDGMRTRPRGRVIFIASVNGLAGSRYTSAYTTSKHAAVGAMRAIAAELAGTTITANAVCPTYVATEMTAATVRTIRASTGRTSEEAEAALTRSSPLGRLLQPQEVAAAVGYLASPDAAAVNGQALVLDGGGIQR